MESGAPARVTPLVRRAWHATGLACTAESLLLGAGLSLLTLAAAWSSGAGSGWTALSLAVVTGILFGLAWRIEQGPQLAQVASGVDSGLRLGGALVTAYESEQTDSDGALVRLLSQRVRSRVKAVEVLRAALPNSLPFLAAPFLGAVVLLNVRNGAEVHSPPGLSAAPALGAMADALAEAKNMGFEDVATGHTSQENASLLADLEREARSLAERSERSVAPDQGPQISEQLESLEQRLEERLAQAERDLNGPSPREGSSRLQEAPRQALERALAHLDSARHALGQVGDSAQTAANPALGRGGLGAADGGRQPDATDNSGGSLASGGESGTISPTPTTTDPIAETPLGTVPDAGGLSGAGIWPARHRDLVGAWIRTLEAKGREGSDH